MGFIDELSSYYQTEKLISSDTLLFYDIGL